jgi:hypothetical protein
MSVLANASNANPTTYYWAEAGSGGGGTNIQSPATVLPDGLADASLTVNAGAAAGNANVSVVAGASGIGTIELGGGGSVYTISANEAPLAGGSLQISVAPITPGQTPVFQYNPTTGDVVLGDSQPTGQVQIDNKLLISAAPFNGNAVEIQSVNATSGAILNTCAAEGGLSLGSSAAFPSTLLVADVTGTAKVGIGGNTGSTILLTGGAGASQTSIINTSATGVGSLLLGPSAVNDRAIFLNDTGGAANTAVVDITRGTAAGVALRLQGYGAVGTAATVSTNSVAGVLNVSSGPSDVSPAIVISPTATTMNRTMTTFAAPNAGAGYTGVMQQSINAGGSLGLNIPWAISNPPSAGIYLIMVRIGDNEVININGQINSVGYYSGSTWLSGGIASSPPLGTGNLILWFGTASSSRNELYLQNTGSANFTSVVVTILPLLTGALSIT